MLLSRYSKTTTSRGKKDCTLTYILNSGGSTLLNPCRKVTEQRMSGVKLCLQGSIMLANDGKDDYRIRRRLARRDNGGKKSTEMPATCSHLQEVPIARAGIPAPLNLAPIPSPTASSSGQYLLFTGRLLFQTEHRNLCDSTILKI